MFWLFKCTLVIQTTPNWECKSHRTQTASPGGSTCGVWLLSLTLGLLELFASPLNVRNGKLFLDLCLRDSPCVEVTSWEAFWCSAWALVSPCTEACTMLALVYPGEHSKTASCYMLKQEKLCSAQSQSPNDQLCDLCCTSLAVHFITCICLM